MEAVVFVCLGRAAAGIEICSSPGESSDLGRKSSNEIFRFLLGTFSVVVLTTRMIVDQWRSQPDNLVMLCKFFCVYRV